MKMNQLNQFSEVPNLALNDKNNIRSVNGPPGTGKTTLLKDIFADLVVEQAKEICELSQKRIDGSIVYYKEKGKIGFLPNQISGKNIVVASSNNGAVQNIVNELPLIEDVAEEFRQEISEVDYFKTISNSKIIFKWIDGKIEKEIKQLNEEKNWGTFSLEGGKNENVKKLLLKIEDIEKHLEDDYQPSPNVYQDFLYSYNKLSSERDRIQKYSEQIRKLKDLKIQYEKRLDNFTEEREKRQNIQFTFEQKVTSELGTLQYEKKKNFAMS